MTDLKATPSATEKDLLVAFFDLSRFMRDIRHLSSRDVFTLLSEYYEFVGEIIEEAGGTVVKFIGDATLVVFPEDQVDDGVMTIKTLKDTGDEWFAKRGMQTHHNVKVHFGPVACGPIGTKSNKQFDVFGDTVNIAATLAANHFAMTPQVFRKLSPETRKHFKKHTPPITYIPIEEEHRD